MARVLSFTIEPSDVLLALLRLRASAEARRWPRGISQRFARSMEREFTRLEPSIRAIGVCYAELEERRVAELDRRPQSRFADVDGALHLAACSIDVALELDPLRVAVERGDITVQEGAVSLSNALRHVLWYVVHTDLLVCPRTLMGGADVGPERALAFVDTYLSEAWAPGAPVDPPLPPRENLSGEHGRVASLPEQQHPPLPFTESTAVFEPLPDTPQETDPGLSGAYETLDSVGDELTAPASLRSFASSLDDDHEPLGSSTLDDNDVDASGAHPALRVGFEHYATPTRSSVDALPPDAVFFLDQSGAPWPCNAEHLSAARALLMIRAPISSTDFQDRAMMRDWLDRVERGFAELRDLLPR